MLNRCCGYPVATRSTRRVHHRTEGAVETCRVSPWRGIADELRSPGAVDPAVPAMVASAVADET